MHHALRVHLRYITERPAPRVSPNLCVYNMQQRACAVLKVHKTPQAPTRMETDRMRVHTPFVPGPFVPISEDRLNINNNNNNNDNKLLSGAIISMVLSKFVSFPHSCLYFLRFCQWFSVWADIGNSWGTIRISSAGVPRAEIHM